MVTNASFGYTAANRLASASGSTSRSFGYDSLGNLVSDTQGSRTYSYDAFNRLGAVYVSGALAGDCRSKRATSFPKQAAAERFDGRPQAEANAAVRESSTFYGPMKRSGF